MTSWLTTDSRTSDATDAVIDPSDALRASEPERHAAALVPGAH